MPPIRPRDWVMPFGAFSMVIVLGSFIYSSIGHAKANAQIERERMLAEIMKQREDLGMNSILGRKRPGE